MEIFGFKVWSLVWSRWRNEILQMKTQIRWKHHPTKSTHRISLKYGKSSYAIDRSLTENNVHSIKIKLIQFTGDQTLLPLWYLLILSLSYRVYQSLFTDKSIFYLNSLICKPYCWSVRILYALLSNVENFRQKSRVGESRSHVYLGLIFWTATPQVNSAFDWIFCLIEKFRKKALLRLR